MDASNVQCYKYDFISLKLVLIIYTRVNYKLLAVNSSKKKERESHWKFPLDCYHLLQLVRTLNTVGNKKMGDN